jgi:hypothetical protein
MTNDSRFEFRLPACRRRQLDELAEEAGMATSDLVRLGLGWLIRHPDKFGLPSRTTRHGQEAAR